MVYRYLYRPEFFLNKTQTEALVVVESGSLGTDPAFFGRTDPNFFIQQRDSCSHKKVVPLSEKSYDFFTATAVSYSGTAISHSATAVSRARIAIIIF